MVHLFSIAQAMKEVPMQKQRSISLFMALPLCSAMAASLLMVSCVVEASAQQAAPGTESSATTTAPVIPQQVRYAGTVGNRAGDAVEAVFRIYSAARGGEPLWTETQRVAVGPDGSYSVVLGGMSPKGLPQSLFAGGQARWLGVSVEQAPEQGRALLASVPYSMKSADAEALAGHAVSDFVTQEQFAALSARTAAAQAQAAEASAAVAQPYTATPPTGSGTPNTVPLWTAATTLGNSMITQGTQGIGINQPTPATTLDVGGAATVRGTLALPATAAATASAGTGSQKLELSASTFSKTPAAAVPQNFILQAAPSGNNTTSPSASLNLLFGSGTTAPAATGLSIGTNGQITFAAGQTFPGAATGTITGITTTSPLTGSGTSGSVALGLNTSSLVTTLTPSLLTALKSSLISGITTTSPLTGSGTSGSIALSLNTTALQTSLNSSYAQLGVGNIFASYVEANLSKGPGNAALSGWGTKGTIGAFGGSDTGYGVQGNSVSGFGVFGEVTAPVSGSSAILGTTGTAFSSTYGPEAKIANAAVWADTSGQGTGLPVAILGTGNNAYSGAFVNNGKSYPALFAQNGTGTAGEFVAATGDGLDASTTTGTGVFGSTQSGGSGVVGLVQAAKPQEAGVVGIANKSSSTGAEANLDTYAGVWGDTGSKPILTGNGYIYPVAVMGTADDANAAVFVNNSKSWSTIVVNNLNGATGLFKSVMVTSPDGGACGMGSGGSLSCTGPIKGLVSSGAGGHTVETYSMQSPESWMEDFGSGTLRNGAAVVSIDPAFAETVTADAGYHVFLTPNGDSKGLYVTAKSATSFEVHESGGGAASLSFDYRIVARRRGFEAQRLVDVSETFNAEMRTAAMRTAAMPGSPGLNATAKAKERSPLALALNSNGRRLAHPAPPMAMPPLAKKTAPTRP